MKTRDKSEIDTLFLPSPRCKSPPAVGAAHEFNERLFYLTSGMPDNGHIGIVQYPSWPKVQGLTPHSRLENKMYIRWATHFLAYYVRPVDLLCPPFGFAHFISVATERPANKLDAGTSDSRSTGATDAKAMCCCVCALACLPPLSAQC